MFLFCFSLSSFLTSQLDVVAKFGIPVDVTFLLATVILMMAGATKKYPRVVQYRGTLVHVSHQKAEEGKNIVQTENEGKDL